MRAVRIHEHGGIDRLILEDVEKPKIKPNYVLVKIKACALNHLDIWTRIGLPGVKIPLPIIPGSDIAGIIEEVGEEVNSVNKGDRVLLYPAISCGRCIYCLQGNEPLCEEYKILGYKINGGYAEYISVPENIVIKIPEKISFEEAAAVPLVFLTSWRMIVTKANVGIGETALVWAAGSGVGSASIQILKLLNCTVIGTVGKDEKINKAYEIGCDYVINYKKEDIVSEIKKITEGKGVDLVIEHVGQDTIEKSIKSTRRGGRIITCGATSGYACNIDIRYIYSKQISIIGSYMGSKSELLTVLKFIFEGKLKPVIDTVFSLEEVQKAHARMELSEHFGKIVLGIEE